MPFKSKAQARLLWAKAGRGEISKAKVQEFADATKSIKKLPEKVKKSAADHVKSQPRKHSDD